MDIAITKMSSKGQVVIPQDMRKDLKEGDKLLVIHSDKHLILKKASDLDAALAEDLEFARRSDDILDRLEKGEGTRMGFDDFIKEIKKW